MRRETALILLFSFGPLIRRLRASFAFRASSDARRESRRAIPARSLSLSRARVCGGGGSQGYTHVRAHAYPCAMMTATSESRDFARSFAQRDRNVVSFGYWFDFKGSITRRHRDI